MCKGTRKDAMFGGSFGVRISDIVKFGLWVLVESFMLAKEKMRTSRLLSFPGERVCG